MSGPLPRTVMAIALALMRDHERPWAQAMAIEFDAADQDGHGLGFAMGCVTVAVRRLAVSSAGWHVMTRYGVALGILLPMALFHLGCAVHGLRCWLSDIDPYLTTLEAGNAAQRMTALAYRNWSPPILVCLTALGIVHVLIAWWIAGSDWHRARRAMVAAGLIVAGLLLCIAAVHPTMWGMVVQCIALAAELLAIPLLATWQTRQVSAARTLTSNREIMS